MSAIGRLIDAVVRCVKCGEPPGCRCWVKVRCPWCGRTSGAERTADDGDGDTTDYPCPKCVDAHLCPTCAGPLNSTRRSDGIFCGVGDCWVDRR